MIYTAIMGHGVVGSGVAELMIEHTRRLSKRVRDSIELKYILDLRDFDDLSYSDKFIKDFTVIANDPTVKIVVETMGGLHPAYDFVKECLEKGKSVVTSNKELVAAKGCELLKIAEENNVNFLFEASVGGGIPILRPMAQCLAANKISEVYGILNGPTNYILNKMIVDNMDFASALKLAQENGFAEKNPDSDILGIDACRKICILASLAFGKHVYPENVLTEGIEDITLRDIANADKFHCVIKLIGRASREENGCISVSVMPTLISKERIISKVDGVFNAITVKGDACGELMFYGRGAGKMPTASAVVADVLDCAKHLKSKKYLSWEDSAEGYVIPSEKPERLYVSVKSEKFDKLLETFDKVFYDNTWNIKDAESGEIAFITESAQKSVLLQKISSLSFDSVKIMNTLY